MIYSSEAETRKHIKKVGDFLLGVIQRLTFRIIQHDESKLSDAEKPIFDKYTPKLANTTYGSEKYKKFLTEMQPALRNHYAKNTHHPEHYLDSTGIGPTSGLHDMNLIDIVEMLCDWKAATLRHKDGDIIKSIEQNQKRFGYSDELKQIFKNTVGYLF